MSHTGTVNENRPGARRRWTWEHVILVWLVAAGAAVGATLARFPPGRPVRPLFPPPSRLAGPEGGRAARALLRRERLLVAGWVAAPLGAAIVTAAWAVGGLRTDGRARDAMRHARHVRP